MYTRILIAIVTLSVWPVMPAYSQEFSPFNVHIGGGIGVPVNSTRGFAGISGTAQFGAGPNLSRHNSIMGEFMWQGLPPNTSSLLPLANPLLALGLANKLSISDNLFSLTANYVFHLERHRYGFYVVSGGGWYYRHFELSNYAVQSGVVCQPVWTWYGYSCVNGFVSTSDTLVSHGESSGGVNGGAGLTINLGDDANSTKFFMEARYHYSPQGSISMHVLPVTFGLRW